jgi:hypothetical protein
LRSESWIVAGQFHSTRKFLRRSRGILGFPIAGHPLLRAGLLTTALKKSAECKQY